MTTRQTVESIEPLDPDSELGQRVANDLADVLDDVAERQAREAAAAQIAAAHSP